MAKKQVKQSLFATVVAFCAGKKTYAVAALTVALGLLQGNTDMVLQGLGFVGLRLGVAKVK